MSDDNNLILYERLDKVAIITLNRPSKLNALNREMWTQLDAALQKATHDPGVSVVMLMGEGRAFCAGADISGGEDPAAILPWLGHFRKHYQRQFNIWESDKIFIAMVHGHAIGRGLELALWCDIVVAADDAKLGQPEIREGMLLWSVIPWLCDAQKAKLLMMSGDLIDATEAKSLGLVAKIFPTALAKEKALALARRLSLVPPVGLQNVKRMVNTAVEMASLRAHQESGIPISAAILNLSPKERGTEELERIRAETGFKASIAFRDAPFKE